MTRRNGSNSSNSNRVRKISLQQNDYAFGIISPVSSTTLPVPVPLSRCSSEENRIPCIVVRPWQVETRRCNPNDPDIDFGIDPLSDFSSSPNSNNSGLSSSERFRRWSFSNFQSAFKATDPSGTEVSSQFTSDDEEFMRSRRNINGSYLNIRIGKPDFEENWISDLMEQIPEKIRKISTEKKPSLAEAERNIYHPGADLKQQLKRVYVY